MNWISVTEQTPNEGQIVLVYQDNQKYPQYNILVLIYEDSAFRDIRYDEEDYEDGVYLFVTHWMSLPEKP